MSVLAIYLVTFTCKEFLVSIPYADAACSERSAQDCLNKHEEQWLLFIKWTVFIVLLMWNRFENTRVEIQLFITSRKAEVQTKFIKHVLQSVPENVLIVGDPDPHEFKPHGMPVELSSPLLPPDVQMSSENSQSQSVLSRQVSLDSVALQIDKNAEQFKPRNDTDLIVLGKNKSTDKLVDTLNLPERYLEGGTIDSDSFLRERIFHKCVPNTAQSSSSRSNESAQDIGRIRLVSKEVMTL